MARKPSDIVQPNLRIREELRRRLEREAKKRGVSLNTEMNFRLDSSFTLPSAEKIVEDMKNVWARYGEAIHQLNKQGDLIRAAEALVVQIETQDREAVAKAVARVKQAIALIEQEAALALRKMHTTGADK